MLTLHTADTLVRGAGPVAGTPVPEGAVLVEGDRIAAVGPYRELAAAYPHARVRRWPGLLVPGLAVRGGTALLERAYWPDDPYELAELGPDPLTGPALAALAMTESRWGNSARRVGQKLLARGVVAVEARLAIGAVRTAVGRSGLAVLEPGTLPAAAGPAPADPRAALDPLAGLSDPGRLPEVFAGLLTPGTQARFAVFDVPDAAALLREGATRCVATVIGGRLLHRRR
ncbi:imidazolonepropionase-like domain-containing protein [Streptomyces sp. BI20]|uniref:imidazolonepropionase-like domain-containing protein n=1 Tax=Streptomyces sp. BI20 TaxID=3403460 RepID=UPI003C707B5F